MLRFAKIKGFTFTELLIALTLNALLLSAILTIFLSNLNYYYKTINATRLTQQLETAMNLMSNDIRRAGYWANAKNDIDGTQNNNPFMANGTDISVNSMNNCILLTYDHNSDGLLPTINAAIDDDRYGYRLNANTLQARPPGAQFSCTAPSANWENLTDPGFINITSLVFTLSNTNIITGPGTKGISFRGVTITLSGNLTSDSTVSRTITQYVRIRNDKYFY